MSEAASARRIVVVGQGPAGISAALYATRAGIATTVIGRDGGALEKTGEIENYYGFAQAVPGHQLVAAGQAQARRLGAQLVTGEVVDLAFEDKLVVRTTGAEYTADAVILATGASRRVPPIPGLAGFEGRGVSYCAVCDGFFFKGKDVAVLGSGEFALHEIGELLPVVGSVTMLTGGQPAPQGVPAGVRVAAGEVAAFTGTDSLEAVAFKDGTTLEVAGVFIALGVAGSGALARKLGAATQGSALVVDQNMATNVPGLFAAGDCTGGLLQVAKAVYEGAKAGTEAVKYVRAARP